jgi:hypothetical protein
MEYCKAGILDTSGTQDDEVEEREMCRERRFSASMSETNDCVFLIPMIFSGNRAALLEGTCLVKIAQEDFALWGLLKGTLSELQMIFCGCHLCTIVECMLVIHRK